MAKQPLKANLFRFVTVRNPQLIETKGEDETPGFVFHPDPTKSAFYSAVKTLSDADKPAALKTVSDNFTPFKTRTDVQKTYEKLYTFSSWLMRNKNALTYYSIQSNIGETSALTLKQEIKVWENLIYQTINKTSVYVREACIQLLIANKFFKSIQNICGKFSYRCAVYSGSNQRFYPSSICKCGHF